MKKIILTGLFLTTTICAAMAQTVLPALTGHDIRIASHNLLFEYAHRIPQEPDRKWSKRLPAIKDLYSRCQVDIIGSQEALGWQGLEFMEAMGYAAVGQNQIGYPEDGVQAQKEEHERIFYRPERFIVKKTGNFWFSETPDIPGSWAWDADHTRMCTWAKFQERATGIVFYVFNAQFHYNAMRSRLESAKLLMDRVRKIAGDATAFCTGDFNGRIDSEAISLIDQSGIVFDARKLAGDNIHGPNWSFHGFSTEPREGFIIDHVFVTSDIKVNAYRIVDDELQTGRWCSDHLPLFVDVTLPEK